MHPLEAAPVVTITGAAYVYPHARALDGIDLEVREGSYTGIVGRNGSGKTTLAHLIAGILKPTSGSVDTHGRRVGLVLSTPANQIVSAVVEEDVAFGPENLGLPPEEIERRVDASLRAVHAQHLRMCMTSALSGGQLAKIVHAGQLAMEVDILVLDEGTAMLDPLSRLAIIEQVAELNERFRTTVIHISHRLEDLVHAREILVMESGRIVCRTGGACELASVLGNLGLEGIETGPEIVYRRFLAGLGIEERDLRKATVELARIMDHRPGM